MQEEFYILFHRGKALRAIIDATEVPFVAPLNLPRTAMLF